MERIENLLKQLQGPSVMKNQSPETHDRVHTASHASCASSADVLVRKRRRVGFIGYGNVGRFLVRQVRENPKYSEILELAFVCDPANPSAVRNDNSLPSKYKLNDLANFSKLKPDLVVEVAHPVITKNWGIQILRQCDYMVASTTTFADEEVQKLIMAEANRPTGHGVYLAAGALWGAHDIQKMSDRGTLAQLTLTMKKHPESLKLRGELADRLSAVRRLGNPEESLLYDGPVRGLCPLAPNNVNTLATAAIAAWRTLGFDGTRAVLICDPRLQETVITVDVRGLPASPGGQALRVNTQRHNPAAPGAITGTATYLAFLSSLLVAATSKKGDGLHLC